MRGRRLGYHIVRLHAGALIFSRHAWTLVEFLLEIDGLVRIGRELDERVPGAPYRLVVPHLAVISVVLSGQRGKPPDGLEAHVGIRFAAELASYLRNVLEPPFAEHLQNLAVPLVVLGGGNAVVGHVELTDLVTIGEVRYDDDDRLLPVCLNRLSCDTAKRAGLVTFRVDVARHHRGGGGIVRVQQPQRNDCAGIDRKAVVVDRGGLQPALPGKRAVKLSKGGIDAELVWDLAHPVPVRVDEQPLRLGVGLHEMPDDGEPLRGVEQQKFGARALDLTADRFVAGFQRRPARVPLGREQHMRLSRYEIRFLDQHRSNFNGRTTRACRPCGATARWTWPEAHAGRSPPTGACGRDRGPRVTDRD